MLIVLEGPNGAGKTTLAKTLQQEFNGASEVLHQGPPPEGRHILSLYESDLIQGIRGTWLMNPANLTICDRWHVGEMFYGPKLRGQAALSPAQISHIEMLLMSLGAVRVIVDTPADVIAMRSAGDDSHLLIAPEDLVESHGFYKTWAVRYGWLQASGPMRDVAHMLIDFATETNRLSREIRAIAPDYVGSLTPRLLLVGEYPGTGPRSDPEFSKVAFTPARKGSAADFLMTVIANELLETDVAVINTHTPHSRTPKVRVGTNIAKLEDILHAQQDTFTIVALGNIAAEYLDRQAVRHYKITHPSWFARFNGDHDLYAAAINDIYRARNVA